MADATYNTPVARPSKAGVRVESIEIHRGGPHALVTISEVDSDDNVLETRRIDLAGASANPAAVVRDFVDAILTPLPGDPGNPNGKLNRRVLKYLVDRGVLSGLTP